MFNGSKRTAAVHLGVGSREDKNFRGYDYAANLLYPFDDKNFTKYADWHPQLDGVFYKDKKTTPSFNPCIGEILKAEHGKITPETLYSRVTGLH